MKNCFTAIPEISLVGNSVLGGPQKWKRNINSEQRNTGNREQSFSNRATTILCILYHR